MNINDEILKARTYENGCSERACKRGDRQFTLVGQDKSSPVVICEWIKQNIETAPSEKLVMALMHAIDMRQCTIRKTAD